MLVELPYIVYEPPTCYSVVLFFCRHTNSLFGEFCRTEKCRCEERRVKKVCARREDVGRPLLAAAQRPKLIRLWKTKHLFSSFEQEVSPSSFYVFILFSPKSSAVPFPFLFCFPSIRVQTRETVFFVVVVVSVVDFSFPPSGRSEGRRAGGRKGIACSRFFFHSFVPPPLLLLVCCGRKKRGGGGENSPFPSYGRENESELEELSTEKN